jgi:prepilin-type processing-associated H-X9-DG protein
MEKDAPDDDVYAPLGDNSGFQMGRACVARHSTRAANRSRWTTVTSPPKGAVNVGLFDGHAELSKLPNLWNYTWHNNWNPSLVSIGRPQ